MKRRQFLGWLACATLPSTLIPREIRRIQPATRRWVGVQDFLNAQVTAHTIAGAVVALSYRDTPVTYLTAGGIALDSDRRPDKNSIYRIHSTSKVVTGVAVMRLIQDHKLDIDQPVADLIPEWKSLRVAIDVEKGLASRPARTTMTVRHLLTHTSGLSYWIPAAGSGVLPTIYRERGITPGDIGLGQARQGYGPQARDLSDMIARLAELPLATDPGTAYRYSVGYDVLGHIIERVTGRSLEAYFRERIFRPLKMDSTGFQVGATQAGRLTTNYEVSADGLTAIDRPESSAWRQAPTLVADWCRLPAIFPARLTGMLLGGGAFDGAQVLHPDIARLACSNLLPEAVTSDSGYGAGMRITKTPKPRSWQSPGPPGTLSFGGASGCRWMVDPVRGGTMVFMTQRMPGPANFSLWNELHAAVDAELR